MLLLTLRGTPTVYYGDEIGMTDVDIPEHLIVDPPGKADPKFSRDPARTPMQWDDSHAAGFTTGDPWLPVADDFTETNVAAQQEAPDSMLTFFRSMMRLRKNMSALNVGSYATLETGSVEVFAYRREHEGQLVTVALNFSGQPRNVDLGRTENGGEILCSTHMDRGSTLEPGQQELRPYEGLVVLSSSESE
jgi:alpha-glucosidase